MQTTDQVAGEALQTLASKIAHSNAWAKAGGFTHATVLLTDADATLIIEALAAALRAQPERGAEEMRPAIHAWVREDLPRAINLEITHEHVTALIAKLRALPLHPAKDEGGGR